MSEHVEKTISIIEEQIECLSRELSHKKQMVNSLCELIGREPRYHDVEDSASRSGSIRPDQFYGKPLASVARQVLELRGSALSVTQIYDVMKEGGFQFEQHKNVANAKRSLRISLSKNTTTFHKLPNNTFGLLEWYPNVKNGAKNKEAKPELMEVESEEVVESEEGMFDELFKSTTDQDLQEKLVTPKG